MFFVFASLVDVVARSASRISSVHRGERGQATAEYALVLLGAAAIAVLLAAWAAKSGAISRLFDEVVDQLIEKAR